MYCTKCGAKLADDSLFCHACGSKVVKPDNVAKENNVSIVENKPLARMLFSNVEIGAEIPPELYQSVAEVLAAVYQANN